MSITWGTMKSYIRIGMLKDVPTAGGSNTFADDALLIAGRWASVSLSQSQAQQTTQTITCDGVLYQYATDSTMVDDLEKAGLVILHRTDRIEYLPPVRSVPGEQWPTSPPTEASAVLRAYHQWNEQLVLTFIPASTDTLEIRYWKNWPVPVDDNTSLTFPIRLEQPFANLAAAFALDPLGAQAATIRTWNRKQDSGTPEDNSLQKQSMYFLAQADALLKDIGPQDRETFYNSSPRDLGFKR